MRMTHRLTIGLVPRRWRSRRGLTLLETVIAIVIGLVILAGIGTLVYKSMSTNKVATAYSNFSTIVSNLRDLYSGQMQTPSTSVAVYINAGVFPETMVSGTSTVVNQWGGTVHFSASGSHLWVIYTGVPQNACIQLSQRLANLAWDQDVVINGSVFANPTVATAESNCSSASSNAVGIIFNTEAT